MKEYTVFITENFTTMFEKNGADKIHLNVNDNELKTLMEICFKCGLEIIIKKRG